MALKQPSYLNVLQISREGKGVPYGGFGDIRADGDANYGFKNLKGRPEALADVPELACDKALYEVIAAINDPGTGLFSVGCASGDVAGPEGHCVQGYVEFAFNSEMLAADAVYLFQVFFHFEQLLRERDFAAGTHFYWDLMGAHFHEALEVDGFTAQVTINTGFRETSESARDVWDRSLALLAEHLSAVPAQRGRPLV